MTNVKNQTQPTQGGINPVVAAVTGVVFGAGVAVAGAMALSNDQNQAKIHNAVDDVKSKVGEVKDKAQEEKDMLETKAKKLADIAKNAKDEVKKI